MWRCLLVIGLFSFLASDPAIAQTEAVVPNEKNLQQLYVGLGSQLGITDNQYLDDNGIGLNAYLNVGLKSNWNFRPGIIQTNFKDDMSRFEHVTASPGDYPKHRFTSTYLLIGKSIEFENVIQLKGMAGPTYTTYREPYDFQGAPLLYLFHTYKTEFRNHYYIGGLVQAEALFMPGKSAGFTLSGFFNFIPQNSFGGLGLTLNLGLLRREKGYPEIL
ncbi:hypothetical protein [Adhaeribacter soli]|uniref:Outer membrane protein beta-barrel domain-containing protein n=1 Tax=Adhaeribacter soli TaxID=2607655 RepID=A0A5N1IX23_9BACT|nr:hypothetical protein [Adhaeribacter soli]KAA9338870.1 hypothetical protein F0P94_08735 [Adhaeribacter soli]